MSYSSQDGNLVQYSCGVKTVKFINGSTAQEAYTTSLSIANHTLSGDQNNSIVVYATVPKDLFYQEGDSYIVHRVYAVLNESGNYYFLTKGDNNPGLDLQYGNYPANSTAVKGTIIIAIPYLGYLKLILTNQFNQPAGCSSTVQQ
jgi:hypothetical protein